MKKHLLTLAMLALTAPAFSTDNATATEAKAAEIKEKNSDAKESIENKDDASAKYTVPCVEDLSGTLNATDKKEVSECQEVSEPPLPEAKMVDERLDLEKTMRMMGKNFGALFQAETIEEMKAPLKALSDYTGQAALLGLSMEDVDPATLTDEQKADYQEGIKVLRKAIIELQVAIDANDLEKAKSILETIKSIKQKGHKRFNVG